MGCSRGSVGFEGALTISVGGEGDAILVGEDGFRCDCCKLLLAIRIERLSDGIFRAAFAPRVTSDRCCSRIVAIELACKLDSEFRY